MTKQRFITFLALGNRSVRNLQLKDFILVGRENMTISLIDKIQDQTWR